MYKVDPSYLVSHKRLPVMSYPDVRLIRCHIEVGAQIVTDADIFGSLNIDSWQFPEANISS